MNKYFIYGKASYFCNKTFDTIEEVEKHLEEGCCADITLVETWGEEIVEKEKGE